MRHRNRIPAAVPWTAVFMLAGCASGGGETTECPDSTRVAGSVCHLAPDGTYYGDGPSAPDDAADEVLDGVDRDMEEDPTLIREETIRDTVGHDD